jgi:hypothetical protein
MANSLSSLTAGVGGVQISSVDTSGSLDIKSGTTTIVSITSAGAAVTGTLSASGATTFPAGSAAAPAITTTGDTNTGIFFPAADTIAFAEGGAEAMRIDSSGNVGISTTPSAWQSSSYRVIEFPFGVSLFGQTDAASMELATNAYLNSSYNWTYKTTAAATHYRQYAGQHQWFTAPSGTAGNAITFTQAMTLDASGNLGIGTASPSNKLDVSGTGDIKTTIQSTSSGSGANAALKIKTATEGDWIIQTGNAVSSGLRFNNASGERIRIDADGKLGIATGNLSVVTTSGQGASIGTWNSSYAVISPNAGSTTGAGLGLAYNTSNDSAEIISMAPSVAWKPLYLYSGGLFFNSANGVSTGSLSTAGNLTITGATATKASGTTWANPSDIRLKDNVTDYSKGLAELMQVNVKEWTYNGKGGTTEGMKGLGVIADEIMTVLPDTVDTYQAKLNADDEADTYIKKFDATEITWLMLNAIKELKAEIDLLKGVK